MSRPRSPASPFGVPWSIGVAVVLAASVSACGGADDDRLVVFAASSLTDVFDELEVAFEAANPGVDVVISYGGSSSLAAQIDQGAPADVFAAADEVTMALVAGEAAGEPVAFARNRLAIAVEPGNPARVGSLADLARDDLVIVVAAPEVPAGGYAREVATEAGVDLAPDSLEQSVRAVASKVALGEADAGIVYRTDIAADDRLDEVPIDTDVAAVYPIVALGADAIARSFVELVTGDVGRAALTAAGFEAP